MAVSYDQIYKEEYEKQLGDSVTRLQKSQEQQEKALKAGYDQQQQALTDNKNKALREAYISKMKEERDMPSTMARQGLNGGMTESNIASIQRNYQNNRNAAETNYNDNKTSLDVGYEGDLANIRSQYIDAISTAKQNASSLALTSAGQRYNAAVAEEEAAAAAAAAAAASSGRSGGSSSRSAGNDTDTETPVVENNGSALANQSGLAGTGSDNTATPKGSKTYKSYDYQEKYLNGQKYIYKYGVRADGTKVYLGMSKAASQSNTNSLSGQSGLSGTSGQSGQNTSSKLITSINTVTIAGKKYRKTTYANGQVKYTAI